MSVPFDLVSTMDLRMFDSDVTTSVMRPATTEIVSPGKYKHAPKKMTTIRVI